MKVCFYTYTQCNLLKIPYLHTWGTMEPIYPNQFG